MAKVITRQGSRRAELKQHCNYRPEGKVPWQLG